MATLPENRPPTARALEEEDVEDTAAHEIIELAFKEARIVGYRIVSYAVTCSKKFLILRGEIRGDNEETLRGLITLWRDPEGLYFVEIHFSNG